MTNTKSHRFKQGSTPLLVSFPHNGSHIPDPVAANMTEAGRTSRDTDWFLDRLYDLPELDDASLIVAEQSRYVIDLNRSRDNQSLYPGRTTTGLIPMMRFDGQATYSVEPNAAEINRRIDTIWSPYHERIDSELNRMIERFGTAVLIEAHSIEPVLPRLFEGRLPDFNIGTNRGESCAAGLSNCVTNVLQSQSQYTHVVNGRFLGGYITRNFGRPEEGRHAIQFELSQATYMDEVNKVWDAEKASSVQSVFRKIISEIKHWLTEQQN